MPAQTRTVNILEAKTHLSRLVRSVEAGDTIAIARAGKVVAHLVPRDHREPREWGYCAGQVRIEPGAFDPMSDEELDEWYGRGVGP